MGTRKSDVGTHGGVLAGALLLVAAISPVAHARDDAALSWVREPGAASCISAIELGRRVEQHIGPVLVSASQADISVEGRITARNSGYRAVVTVNDEDGRLLGERRLQSDAPDCHALDEAIVFVVAVAVDPHAALASLPSDLAPSVGEDPAGDLYAELQADPPQPAPASSPDSSPEPSPPPKEPPSGRKEDAALGIALSAGAAIAGPLLPKATLGVHAALQWEPFQQWLLRFTGNYWFPHDVPIPILDEPARLSLFQLGVQLCRRLLDAGRWRAGACGGLAAARFASEARAQQREHVRWLLGPEVGAYGSVGIVEPLRFKLALTAQALRPRHRVTYVEGDQTRTAYRVPWASARAEISLGLHF